MTTGKLVDFTTIYPHPLKKAYIESVTQLSELINQHKVELIAIGNGTASRETDRLVTDLIKQIQLPRLQKVIVSETGASVYSASALAAKEFPDLDVTTRGAVSIARRLQDPLTKKLDAVVEDCVNAVGVDVNMASSALFPVMFLV